MKKRLGMDSILRKKTNGRRTLQENIAGVMFEVASEVKSLTSFLTSFSRRHKDISNLTGYFGHAWPNHQK